MIANPIHRFNVFLWIFFLVKSPIKTGCSAWRQLREVFARLWIFHHRLHIRVPTEVRTRLINRNSRFGIRRLENVNFWSLEYFSGERNVFRGGRFVQSVDGRRAGSRRRRKRRRRFSRNRSRCHRRQRLHRLLRQRRRDRLQNALAKGWRFVMFNRWLDRFGGRWKRRFTCRWARRFMFFCDT